MKSYFVRLVLISAIILTGCDNQPIRASSADGVRFYSAGLPAREVEYRPRISLDRDPKTYLFAANYINPTRVGLPPNSLEEALGHYQAFLENYVDDQGRLDYVGALTNPETSGLGPTLHYFSEGYDLPARLQEPITNRVIRLNAVNVFAIHEALQTYVNAGRYQNTREGVGHGLPSIGRLVIAPSYTTIKHPLRGINADSLVTRNELMSRLHSEEPLAIFATINEQTNEETPALANFVIGFDPDRQRISEEFYARDVGRQFAFYIKNRPAGAGPNRLIEKFKAAPAIQQEANRRGFKSVDELIEDQLR